VEQLTTLLVEGAHKLGLRLDLTQIEQLVSHLELLAKWNEKLNLVGAGKPAHWAMRHTLDSLAVATWVAEGALVADVGSGAGFPGLPCAIARPGARFVLIEPRKNRAAFLQNAVSACSLRNVTVQAKRAENIQQEFDLVLGRAVAEPMKWERIASRLCNASGSFAAYMLASPPAELGDSNLVETLKYEAESGRTAWLGRYVPRGTPAVP